MTFSYSGDVSAKFARRFLLPGAVALAILAGGVTLWRAERALDRSRKQTEQRAEFAVMVSRLKPVQSSVEAVGSSAQFRHVATWQGHLYIAGSAGLTEFDSDGQTRRVFSSGRELPPGTITDLRAGVVGGEGEELWISVLGEGVLAFDGTSFRHIRPEKPEHRAVHAILPLPTGVLLLGTDRAGVMAFDGKSLKPLHPELAPMRVTALAGDADSVWIGTLDQGVVEWRGGEIRRYRDLPDVQVLSLSLQGSTAWVGTPTGVAAVQGGAVRRRVADGLMARRVYAQRDSVWVGTLDGEIQELPVAEARTRRAANLPEPMESAVEAFVEIDGKVLAMDARQLRPVRGGSAAVRAPEASLSDHNIAALALDEGGRLWIGYFDRGLDVVEVGSAGLGLRRHFEDDRLFCINRIVPQPDRTAVATANGLVLFDDSLKPKQTLTRADGLIANHVTDVVLLDGSMAVATPAGVSFVDASGIRSLYAFHGLVNNHAYALAGSGERLLVGTLGGLSELTAGVVRANYTTANSPLKHNWVSALTKSGDDWFVGTYGAGVIRIDRSGQWLSYPHLPAGLEVNPNAMAASGDRVYAGSLKDGLLMWDRKTDRWRSTTEGLPSRNVTAVAVGGGWVYVGTDNGLVRMRESAW
jgi:ligand-binding sensor domain-containing protein